MWVETAVKGGGQSEGFGVKGMRQLSASEDRIVFPKEHWPASVTYARSLGF